MELPALTVELALTSDPTDTTPTWTDLSDRVRSVSTRRGRSTELEQVNGGTCTVRFDNNDRELDPSNTDGAQAGNLVPMKRMRIFATWDSVDYPIYDGSVESFDQVFPGTVDAVVDITGTDAMKWLTLAKVPVTDDHSSVIEEVFEPLWLYAPLSDKPGVKVIPGGFVKVKDNKDKGKKPQKKWRRARRLKTTPGQAGPEGIVVGNPTFQVAGASDPSLGPVPGFSSYGIQFARASTQYIKFPIGDGDELPGGENRIVAGATFRMTSLSLDSQVIVGGPLFTAGNVIPWRLAVQNIGGELHVVWIVAFSDGTAAQCDTSAYAGLPNGIDTTDEFFTFFGTWNGVTDKAQLFVPFELVDDSSAAGKTMRRGNAPGHVFVGGHQAHTAAGGSNFYANAVISEVFVSEAQIADADPAFSTTGRYYDSMTAGMGFATLTPPSGERVGEILNYVDAGLGATFWGDASMQDIDTGNTDVLPQRWDGSTALDLIRECEETEDGVFFITKDGKAAFRESGWRDTNETILGRFTDRPFGTFGIAVGGAFEFMATGEIEDALDDMVALGVTHIRADCKWAEVEDTQGVYVWEAGGGGAKYDTLEAACRARGIDLTFTCTYSPDWVTGAGADDKVAPSTTGEKNAFAAFCAAVVSRYGPHGTISPESDRVALKAVEIWNEPNLGNTFWKPVADPATYTDLLQRAWDAVRLVDTRTLVLAGTLAASSHYVTGSWVTHSGSLYQSPTDYVSSTPPTGWTNKTPFYGTFALSPTNYVTGGYVIHNNGSQDILYQLLANRNSPRTLTPPNDPTGYTVITGIEAWNVDYAKGREPGKFLDQMYTAGAKGHFDHLSAHPYVFTTDLDFVFEGWKYPQGTGSFLGDTNSLRSKMVAAGDGHKQIWITETSYDGVSDAARAAFVDEILDRLSSYDYVGPISWYTYYVASDDRSIVGAPPTFTHDDEWDALETYLDGVASAEFGYRDIVIGTDDVSLVNKVTVTREDGTPQTAETASIYDRKLEVGTIHTTDADALALAETLLDRYSAPTDRIRSIEILGGADDTAWPTLLSAEVFDRVVVRKYHYAGSGSIEADLRIQGIEIDIEPGAPWRFTWSLAP